MALDRAVVVGHSMGGAIALQLALDHPERLSGLVLVGTGARLRVRDDLRSGFLKDHVRAALRLVERSFASGDAETTIARRMVASLGAIDPSTIAGDFEACHAFDVMGRIDDIRLPTRAICGALDVLTPPKYTRWFGEHIPGARTTVVPGAGHMVMIEQAADVTSVTNEMVGEAQGVPKSDSLG